MKIFFEEYPYNPSKVKGVLDKNLYTDYNGSSVIPYVGYFFNPYIQDGDGNTVGDSIFILPKVFIRQVKVEIDGKKVKKNLAFGKYNPEDIIDINTQDILNSKDDEVIFCLSTWIHRAIVHYKERNSKTKIAKKAFIQNVLSTRGEEDQTFLDTILSLLKFHKRHKNLFTYITIINASGRSTINWDKTINKTTAIIRKGKPFYSETIAKDKAINYDEDLIVLFYSVLNYLKYYLHYRIDGRFKYKLLKPNKIQQLIETGKGTRILKSIRRKYFTDELVALWNLLRVFFDKAHQVATKKYGEEWLLVSNFDRVFEDMIDQLIGDPKESLLDGSLKDQNDDKRVDHIYKDSSLLPGSDIYFIGDSKYYKDTTKITGSAFYKQYTYAKNVIQVCMNIFDGGNGKEKLGAFRYVDTKTEGYNITPNFFISGNIPDFSNMNYTNLDLKNDTPSDISKVMSKHWKDRLFDRDTLILQSYNINFLYVIAAYVTNCQDVTIKNVIHKKFRRDIVKTLNNNYVFYKITPHNLDGFIDKHFRLLNGKMFRGNDDDKFIWLAFEMHSTAFNNVYEAIKDDIIEEELVSQPLQDEW